MSTGKISYPVQDRWSFLWLLLAGVMSLFSLASGKWIIAATAWLSMIFLLRFFRTQPRIWLAYLLAAGVVGLTTSIVMPSSILGDMAIAVILAAALIGPLPLLLDRWLSVRLPGFAGTLVFPLAVTALEFFNVSTNPMGSYGSSAASTQYDNLVLLQLLSLTGMWGLTFLMSWLGSVVNWAWERQFAWAEIRRGALVYAGILLLVMVYGQARLWFAPTPAQTVRVAGFTMVDWRANQPEMNRAFETDLNAFRQMMEQRYQLYFNATIKEARAGAKFISWPENAATIAPEDEPALLARLQALAKQEGIYLLAPILEQTSGSLYANKLVVYDPQGQLVLEHYKYGGAGMEGNRVNGDGILRTVQTPYGVISGIICWDTELQNVVTQSGRNGTDILFTPSTTFREADPMYAHMNIMRAIENGVSIVHVSDAGLSVAADPYGRILASMDHYPQGERALVAQVPTQGAWTLYPIIGDLFGWLSLAGTFALVIFGVVQSLRSRKAKSTR